ncbi:RNA polymerase sigma factor [Tepidibacter thalassicus]|uniref:RNA polymerase, sigma-24 subunit, RpoE n=1 Tax=Tepidibacter thalassicus DSM 15285 TaxID=1123350 RepID=A0A1M5QL15_9FIRM|nr:sigma-70 family RNA polymerase sigma factor [Tepidibacter thalassicus]SHH14489.1 RNA polymerase, sigma-24 subunit, RpoE [Tepidibacter thalassicus DSM 15285]
MDLNENELIKKCINGDVDAFEELIKAYKQKAYNIALNMLKNPEDAMDVSQEAFIKVYKYIKNFNQKSSFSTWLYRIVINTCLDFIKKNEKNRIYSIDDFIDNKQKEIEDNYNNPEVVLDRKVRNQEIHNAIKQLSPVLKTAVILRDIQGFSYDEISSIMNCSLGTVKSRIKRGRENLKKIIKESMKISCL